MPTDRLTFHMLPWPLNNLVPDLLDAADSFQRNAPSHLNTLLEQCAGLAQAAHLATEQCEFLDHDHREALVQTLAVLAGYTRLASALSTALADKA